VGGMDGMEKNIVKERAIHFKGIHAAGVHGVGLGSLPGNVVQLARGVFDAGKILRSFQPDVMFFTGGYVAVPVALRGWAVPSVLFVPDIEPGLALKTLARMADAIAVTAERSRDYFSSRQDIRVTGYPVRSDLSNWTEEDAYQALELSPADPVLLVFGGSKGARSINRALVSNLPELLEETQVLHITGHLDWQEVKQQREQLSTNFQDRYRAFPYLHERMGAAFTVADLVLSRAGASVLGEFPLFGLPAVLVPYPHAWRYQRVNAHYLADRGAAVILEDEQLPEQLCSIILGLVQDEQRLEEMRERMRNVAQPQAAQDIAQLVVEVGEKKGARQ